MFRLIACTLTTGMFCTAAVAQNTPAARDAQAQQQQQPAAGQAAGQPADAQAADQAQPAAARQGQQDPAQMFVMEAYQGNAFEVKAAEMAQQKIQDPEIKKFAQMMAMDHKAANDKLKTIAQAMGVQMSQAGELDKLHQAKLEKMQQCPAAEFDRKYINGQVAGHTMNVLEYRHQASSGTNDQVKQYATQTLPKLQQHLQQASQLAQAQAGGEAQPASGRLPADGAAKDQDSTTPGATDRPGTPGAREGTGTGTGAGQSGTGAGAGQSGTGTGQGTPE